MSAVSHVPAWKRLGLELKKQQPAGEPLAKKRRISNDTERNGSLQFRTEPNSHVAEVGNGNDPVDDSVPTRNSVDVSAKSATAKPIKEVSSKSKAKRSVDRKADVPVDDYFYTDAAIKERKAAKRLKREQRHEKPAQQEEPAKSGPRITTPLDQVPSYLKYLEDFGNDRWKFNKSHQTKLLENIFSLKRVPTEYNQQVSDYIKGLRGHASRERLKSKAQQDLSHDNASDTANLQNKKSASRTEMDDPTNRQRAIEESLSKDQNKVKRVLKEEAKAQRENSDEGKRKSETRRRAELILTALAHLDSSNSQPDSSLPSSHGKPVEKGPSLQNKSRSRGRKRRYHESNQNDTDTSSDSSSSSDVSSESESSDDSAATEAVNGK